MTFLASLERRRTRPGTCRGLDRNCSDHFFGEQIGIYREIVRSVRAIRDQQPDHEAVNDAASTLRWLGHRIKYELRNWTGTMH